MTAAISPAVRVLPCILVNDMTVRIRGRLLADPESFPHRGPRRHTFHVQSARPFRVERLQHPVDHLLQRLSRFRAILFKIDPVMRLHGFLVPVDHELRLFRFSGHLARCQREIYPRFINAGAYHDLYLVHVAFRYIEIQRRRIAPPGGQTAGNHRGSDIAALRGAAGTSNDQFSSLRSHLPARTVLFELPDAGRQFGRRGDIELRFPDAAVLQKFLRFLRGAVAGQPQPFRRILYGRILFLHISPQLQPALIRPGDMPLHGPFQSVGALPAAARHDRPHRRLDRGIGRIVRPARPVLIEPRADGREPFIILPALDKGNIRIVDGRAAARGHDRSPHMLSRRDAEGHLIAVGPPVHIIPAVPKQDLRAASPDVRPRKCSRAADDLRHLKSAQHRQTEARRRHPPRQQSPDFFLPIHSPHSPTFLSLCAAF